MAVTLIDNSVQVKAALGEAAAAFLHEAAGEVVSQAKRNTRVDSGQLKGSWRYMVQGDMAHIGSPLENAIWEEFGTGEYALEGKGRKTPWYVPVEGYTGKKKPTFQGNVIVVRGKNGKQFYMTDGKKPNRTLSRAFESRKTKIIRRAEEIVKGRMK